MCVCFLPLPLPPPCSPLAVPEACGVCPGASFATIASGTAYPFVYSTYKVADAWDLALAGSTSSPGAWTSSAKINWLQFKLTQPEDEVFAINVYGGVATSTTSSGFLTLYISRGTNFTDPSTSTTCQGGTVGVVVGTGGAVTCPEGFLGTEYVTVYRNDPVTADYLVVTEIQVVTGGEWAGGWQCLRLPLLFKPMPLALPPAASSPRTCV